MNIVFLGGFFPQNLLKSVYVNSKGKIGMSNHNFEMSIINGLCRLTDINLSCITIPKVYSYPYNNKRIYTKAEHYQYKNSEIYSIGFLNIPVLRELCSTILCALKLIKLKVRAKSNRVNIIMNTPSNSFFYAIRLAKLFTSWNNQTLTVVIPDIPSLITGMDKQNFIKSILLSYTDRNAINKASKANGLVLLTEAMMHFINKPIRHIVMEGIVDVDTMDIKECNSYSNSHIQVILYTGTLRRIFGVMNLIRAFSDIHDNDVELWICGTGDSESDIIEATKKDKRIRFFGFVDSETALKMQHQATILVNPRTSDGEYTKYSFPSKTLEYMLAGKAVIINKLPGIPEEYYKYVYTPKDESVDALSECIVRVLRMDITTRDEVATKGREFILRNKNSKVQMQRIVELIKSYK